MRPDHTWYPQGEYWGSSDRGFWFFRSEDQYGRKMPYPKSAIAVHLDKLDREKIAMRREVRVWVETTCTETVVFGYLEKNYFYHFEYEGRDKYRHNDDQKQHGYYILHFETDAAAMMFKLAFPHLCDEIDYIHPNHVGEKSLRMRRTGSPNYWDGCGNEYPWR